MSNTTHALVIYDDQCADEFNISGWMLCVKSELAAELEKAKTFFAANNAVETYFGVGEVIEFGDYNELMDTLTIVDITQDEANTLERLFGAKQFGHMCFTAVFDRVNADDEDED